MFTQTRVEHRVILDGRYGTIEAPCIVPIHRNVVQPGVHQRVAVFTDRMNAITRQRYCAACAQEDHDACTSGCSCCVGLDPLDRPA